MILADTAKSPGFPNSDAFVEISDFDGIDLPIHSNPGGIDLPIHSNPGGIDLPINYNPDGIDLPIDYNPGEWGELNGGCFSSSDGGCVSDQVHNSSAGSLTSADSFTGFSRALQRRARNRKNQRASRMC